MKQIENSILIPSFTTLLHNVHCYFLFLFCQWITSHHMNPPWLLIHLVLYNRQKSDPGFWSTEILQSQETDKSTCQTRSTSCLLSSRFNIRHVLDTLNHTANIISRLVIGQHLRSFICMFNKREEGAHLWGQQSYQGGLGLPGLPLAATMAILNYWRDISH